MAKNGKPKWPPLALIKEQLNGHHRRMVRRLVRTMGVIQKMENYMIQRFWRIL